MHKKPYVYEPPIRFSNDNARDVSKITAAFAEHGMTVVDVSWECHAMWTWVLVDSGALWCLDKSHGGGGQFARESS